MSSKADPYCTLYKRISVHESTKDVYFDNVINQVGHIMRSVFLFLLLLVTISVALTVTSVEGQFSLVEPNSSEKEFFHPADTIPSGRAIKTSGTGITLLEQENHHLAILPLTECKIYYTDSLLQISLFKGEIYTFNAQGNIQINAGAHTIVSHGTTSLSRQGDSLKIIAVKGGLTLFNEQNNSGELLKKGYKALMAGAQFERSFYMEDELAPLCAILPCHLKEALFCSPCPVGQPDLVLADNKIKVILPGTLILHPFTVEADNNFPIPAINFTKGIELSKHLDIVRTTLAGKKQYKQYAQWQREGRTDYFVLDGTITPDKNNSNRVICTITLYSGKVNKALFTERMSLFLLDDFATGGKLIDPLFFDAVGKLVVTHIKKAI